MNEPQPAPASKFPPPRSLRGNPAAGASATDLAATLRSGPAMLRRGSAVSLGATVAFVNAMMLAAPADGQSPGTTAAGATEMPEVVVRGQQDAVRVEQVSSRKYTEPLRDLPQTITVIPETVIKERNATTLRDVLRNVPGISIQAGEGGVPAGDNLSIRGFNARTDLFIDGVRDVAGYARDSFNFEQVEVVKGPASAYAGRGSTGGSINIVTKTPKQRAFYEGDAGIGTDNYKRFTIDLNQPVNAFWRKPELPSADFSKGAAKEVIPPAPAVEPTMAVRFNAMWTEADVPNRTEVGGRRWGIAPSIAFGLGTPTVFTLSYMHLDQEGLPDYGIPFVTDTNVPLARFRGQIAPVNFSNWYGLVDRDYEVTRTDVATFEARHAFNDASSLRYLVRYARSKRDSIITAPRFLDDDSTDIARGLRSRDQEDLIFANIIDFTTRFNTWGAEHALVAGVQYDRESQENHLRAATDATPADLYHPNPHGGYDGRIRRIGTAEADSEVLSAFLFDTIKLGEKWQISGGVRYDYNSVDFNETEEGVDTHFSRTDNAVSWRAAIAYKPVKSGTIYAAYGTSYNPSTEGLTSGFSDTNATLEPEESRTFEVGTKWEFLDNQLLVSAAAFRTEKTNARTPGVLPDEPNVLTGEQLVQGFELGVQGNITREWAVIGGYTFLDSRIESSNVPAEVGNELPNTPQQTFSLWTTYQLPWRLQVGVGAQYVGSRFSNNSNTREAPDYWTFDAMARYAVTEHIDVRLNVYNLADEEYLDRLSGSHAVPGPGRSATVTVGFQF
jgi:catecholate siderophore receptor